MKLKTEDNTPETESEILEAADCKFGTEDVQAFFEHGQWFLYNIKEDQYYSVVDAFPGIANELDFEEI